MGGSRKIRQGGPDNVCFLYFTEGHTDLPREAIGPKGPIASRGGSVPNFPRKPTPTCDEPGWEGEFQTPCPPLDPPL